MKFACIIFTLTLSGVIYGSPLLDLLGRIFEGNHYNPRIIILTRFAQRNGLAGEQLDNFLNSLRKELTRQTGIGNNLIICKNGGFDLEKEALEIYYDSLNCVRDKTSLWHYLIRRSNNNTEMRDSNVEIETQLIFRRLTPEEIKATNCDIDTKNFHPSGDKAFQLYQNLYACANGIRLGEIKW